LPYLIYYLAVMDITAKSREVALAILKISVYARRREFKSRLESLAFDLIESSSIRDFESVSNSIIPAIESLIVFGRTIYEIEPANAHMIISRVKDIHDEINKIETFGNSEIKSAKEVDKGISETTNIKITSSQINAGKSLSENPASIENPAINNSAFQIRQRAINPKPANDDNSAIRQSAIIEKIRQSGDSLLQLRDVVAAFPNYSERTLRYDIQRLCGQGVIERVGSGGPGTRYRIRSI